jgi:hypothetical protein
MDKPRNTHQPGNKSQMDFHQFYSIKNQQTELTVPRDNSLKLSYLTVDDYGYWEVPKEIWEVFGKCNAEWHSYPFESVPWLRASAESLPVGICARLLIASDRHLGPVAFWPYALQSFRSGGILPLLLCRSWTEDERIAASIIVLPELDKCAILGILNKFIEKLPRWNKMITGIIRDGSPLFHAIIEVFGSSSNIFTQETYTFAEIRGWLRFEDFLGSLSRDWQRKYKRIISHNQETGCIRVEHIDGAKTLEMLASIKRRIIDIYRESWKIGSPDRYANLALPDAFAYFSKLIEAFAENKCLHIIFATAGGDDAAFYVGVQHGNVYCSLQTAYKEKYRHLSIGFLTQMENFRYTIEHGYFTNNLMANQDYKKHFTDNVIHYSSLVIFNQNIIGSIAEMLSKAKQFCRKLIK